MGKISPTIGGLREGQIVTNPIRNLKVMTILMFTLNAPPMERRMNSAVEIWYTGSRPWISENGERMRDPRAWPIPHTQKMRVEWMPEAFSSPRSFKMSGIAGAIMGIAMLL